MHTRSKRKFEEEKKEDINSNQLKKMDVASKSSGSLEDEYKRIEIAARDNVINAAKRNNLNDRKGSVTPEEEKKPAAIVNNNSVAEESSASAPQNQITSVLSEENLQEIFGYVKKKLDEEKNKEPKQVQEEIRPASLSQDPEGNKYKSQQIQKDNDQEGRHVAALKNPPSVLASPASKRQSRSILNEDDLGVIYDFVLNDKDIRGLNYTQRVYKQGLESDSYDLMTDFAKTKFDNNTIEMRNFAQQVDEWAKQDYQEKTSA